MNILIAGKTMPSIVTPNSLRELHLYAIEVEGGMYHVIKSITGDLGLYERSELAGIVQDIMQQLR